MIVFRVIHLLILIAFLCSSMSLQVVYGQKTRKEKLEEYFQKGIELREKGDIEGAIKAFLYVTARDHGNADAYYQLGLAYMEFPKGNNMKRAEEALWKARRLTRDTRELHALGDFYEKRIFDSVSRIMFKWIVREDSTDVRALTILSDYYFERGFNGEWNKKYDINDYLLFDGKSTRHILEEGKPSLPQRKMTKYVRKGAEMNDRILAVEPDNRTALYRKALGYLEMNDFGSFINLFKRQLEKDREDYNAHLFIGLGYAELGEHDIANAHYQRVLELMDPDDRISFESFLYLKPEFDKSFLGYRQSFKPDRSEIYWDIKDPFYLTLFNERRLEHYGRIAEANLRFSDPSEGIDGWKTLRGYFWIRFGKPIRIKKIWESLIPPTIWQKWEYEDFSFTIMQSFKGSKKVWSISEREILPLINKYLDYYRFKPKGELFNVTTDIICFRGSDGYTDVKVFYEIPVDKFTLEQDVDSLSGEVQHGVFAFYKDNERYNIENKLIYQEVDKTCFSVNSDTLSSDSLKYLVLSNSFEAPPLNYLIGVEALDEKTGNTGTNRITLKIDNFRITNNLTVSGILVAHKASIIDVDETFSKDNISFTANPSHIFGPGKPIHIYFEIYNLYIEDERAQNHYKLEYMIKPVIEEEGKIKSFFKKLVLLGRKEESVSISTEYKGVGTTQHHPITISHNITKPGEYNLAVRVTDLISGMATERMTPIWIY